LKLAADRLKAREVLAKAYIRKEAWAEAAEEISFLRDVRYSSVRYIEGFLAWKQGDFAKAEELFRKAMRHGDNSIQVVRDRAYCLFRLGRHADANSLLNRLPVHAWQNRYVLDLAAQIAIELKNYEAAEVHISAMRHLGEEYDANHRHAALYIKKRNPREAFALLERLPPESRFETHAMRADCLIELDKFDAAQEAIHGLKPQTSGNKDVVQGLRCKLALREGDS
jgi:thioredoxin-like negative regulator of GroEL